MGVTRSRHPTHQKINACRSVLVKCSSARDRRNAILASSTATQSVDGNPELRNMMKSPSLAHPTHRSTHHVVNDDATIFGHLNRTVRHFLIHHFVHQRGSALLRSSYRGVSPAASCANFISSSSSGEQSTGTLAVPASNAARR
jgi:hypothetical protein